jgi:type I restriction enzyme, S subunit
MSDLYDLPKGWEWERLDNLTEVNIGKTPTRSNKEYFLGDKVWLSIRDLKVKGDYVSDSNEKLTNEAIKDSNIKIVPKGTLLMSFKLTLGRTAIADCDLYTNEAIASLPIKDESVLDKYYLKYSIGVIDLEKEVDNAVKGKTLNKQKIKNLDIPLPPLSEQQRIVSKLDKLFEKIDRAIALHQKNMDEADVFMGSVLNDVFGELEEKYETTSLDALSSFQNGFAFKSKEFNSDGLGLRVIRIGNVLNIDKNPVFIDERIEFERYLLNENDIVISMTGTRKKRDYLFVRIVDSNDTYLNQRVGKISNNDKSNHRYLYYYLKSDSFRDKIFEFETGTVNQGNISGKDIVNSKVPNIPLPTQQKVVTYLDSISEKIEKVKSVQKEKLESLKALKASILDEAFRGEL